MRLAWNARYVSFIASTLVLLSAGTNYVYSAYAPQLSDRLHLSATASNMVGFCGNLGVYLSGPIIGRLVDRRGTQGPLVLGAVLLFVGYYGIHRAYVAGAAHATPVPLLALCMALTGIGSTCISSAAVNSCAKNFPRSSTATAIPLSAFGLSAFVYSRLAEFLFPGNTGDFLLLLATLTAASALAGVLFVRIVPTRPSTPRSASRSHGVAAPARRRPAALAHVTATGTSGSASHHNSDNDDDDGVGDAAEVDPAPTTSLSTTKTPMRSHERAPHAHLPSSPAHMYDPLSLPPFFTSEGVAYYDTSAESSETGEGRSDGDEEDEEDAVHLVPGMETQPQASTSRSSQQQQPPPLLPPSTESLPLYGSTNGSSKAPTAGAGAVGKGTLHSRTHWERHANHHHMGVDISGMKLVSTPQFWYLFAVVGLLSGMGLMFINNAGHCVHALWLHTSTESKGSDAIAATAVAVLSIANAAGRVFVGVTSDYVKRRFHMTREWFLPIASGMFVVAQIAGARTTQAGTIPWVAAMDGFAYGALFGIAPTLAIEWFGMPSFAQNCGMVSVSPALGAVVFNTIYGRIYDAHVVPPAHECMLGLACYRPAFFLTTILAAVLAVFTALLVKAHPSQRAAHRRFYRLESSA